MQEWHRESSISLARLPIVLFNLDIHQNSRRMSENGSRRVSSASTSSSFPRTPSSAHTELHEYLWRDPDRLSSLRETFSNSDYGSEDGHATPITPPSAMSISGEAGVLVRQDLERVGWNLGYKSPVRSLSVTSPTPERYGHRIVRSVSTYSPSVRLWPRLPPQANGQEKLLEEELATLRSEGEGRESSDEGKTDEEMSDGASSQQEDPTLRRRRHIRRPTRAKQDLPRRLPPLPLSNTLAHSNSTAARFVSTPFDDDNTTPDPTASNNSANTFYTTTTSGGDIDLALTTSSTAANDFRRRSHTINDLPANRIRPLPPPSKQHTVRNPTTVRRQAVPIPPLNLATLSLRSSPSEAEAVLTKTPNRRFNPMVVPPPMPQDAGNRLDWNLIEDILEIDGEMADLETPIATPPEKLPRP